MLKDLQNMVSQALSEKIADFEVADKSKNLSAVLVLLRAEGSCLILNKRSAMVCQAGDLCCPGGRISLRQDAFLSMLLLLPGLPWRSWQPSKLWSSTQLDQIRFFLATGLRESFEEMRLNPFGVKLLGPLKSCRLQLLNKTIYPLVVWVDSWQRFKINCEVESLIYIPLKMLLNPNNYVCYRLQFTDESGILFTQDYPGFLDQQNQTNELLWGVTFRIIMNFLDLVFNFQPPVMQSLPIITEINPSGRRKYDV